MGARPVTGWVFAPGASGRWASLHPEFGRELRSQRDLDAAVRAAQARWGAGRLVCIRLDSEGTAPERAADYERYGSSGGALSSAWAWIEHGLADAALLHARDCALLIERAGTAPVRLLRGARGGELQLRAEAAGALHALTAGLAAVELGLVCGDDGLEPESASVEADATAWRVELAL